MSKRARQYIGLITAVLLYYLVHEGAHLVFALSTGVFKQINFIGLGIQVDIFAEQLSQTQLGLFCLLGVVATTVLAYVLVALGKKIGDAKSKLFKACTYYVTLIMLLMDPLYLSVLCGFFGGGDMNGISLLMPEIAARIGFGVLLLVNGVVFVKIVLPTYKKAFSK